MAIFNSYVKLPEGTYDIPMTKKTPPQVRPLRAFAQPWSRHDPVP